MTGGLNVNEPPPYQHYSKPIIIKDGVWIAAGAIILPGITIEENSVIAAGAIVTKDVPANTIVAGNPARKIKMINSGVSG